MLHLSNHYRSRKKNISLFVFLSLIIVLFSCRNEGSDSKNTNTNNEYTNETKASLLNIISPINNERYQIGDKIPVAISCADTKIKFDSVIFLANGKTIESSKTYPFGFSWDTKDATTGTQKIISKAYYNGKSESSESSVLLLSDITPKEYTFKIKKTYPHDPLAYTQGLYFENDVFFEGTGGTGEQGFSSLRKVNIETGEILQSVGLPHDIFGEGIVSFKNKIVQITWQSNVGFVYDKKTFKQIGKFNYSTEGWGITTDGKKLIMSDGTAHLYFWDPETFAQIGQVEVCNDKQAIMYLNELEYINGEVWANVYQENYIVKINPETGKVTGKINLAGILDLKGYDKKVDVLNGIAYDSKRNRLFVTGKWWPKLFEIEVIEKK